MSGNRRTDSFRCERLQMKLVSVKIFLQKIKYVRKQLFENQQMQDQIYIIQQWTKLGYIFRDLSRQHDSMSKISAREL